MSGPECNPSIESQLPENEDFLNRHFGKDTGWPPVEDTVSEQRSAEITPPIIEERDPFVVFADGFMDADSGFTGRN